MPKLNPNILNSFVFYPTIEWLNDGIDIESMHRYQIRYSINENKIIIPHYDPYGSLVGVRCRVLNEDELENGKYRPIYINGRLCNHPLGYNLYGLNLIKGNIKRIGMAIITEGEISP